MPTIARRPFFNSFNCRASYFSGVILEGVETLPESAQFPGSFVFVVLFPNGELDNADGGDDLEPRSSRHLRDGGEAWRNLTIVQRMVQFGEDVAECGQHADSAVFELDCPSAEEGGLVFRESERIPYASGFDVGAEHFFHAHAQRGFRHGLSWGNLRPGECGGEGTGRGEACGEKGDFELHFKVQGFSFQM
eukprot:CAMPEP_0171453578 /NCGR_PEP_ID=MMETSP0945-20130129/1225_1 /TAXON_ID=109269 /ORGANISM="Vaucheria litorea, Strain CCMP2940" /LENGTH=190 /DNA_ID=CAMNT_0011978463 /DNA_START=149 /DNA_END=720 /DNA_ORIENTATION=-